LVASNVADLHGDQQRDRNNMQKANVLNVKGDVIPGVGVPQGTQNEHDILTGSDAQGRAYTDGLDHTCGNWTSDGLALPQANPKLPGGAGRAPCSATRTGTGGGNVSWNSTHMSQGVQQGGAQRHRWRRQVLLLCNQLTDAGSGGCPSHSGAAIPAELLTVLKIATNRDGHRFQNEHAGGPAVLPHHSRPLCEDFRTPAHLSLGELKGHVGDQGLPHRSPRRPCCALRERELRLRACP